MFDKIRSIFRHDQQQDRLIENPKSLVEQVLDAPALFNRKTRRSIGLFGKVWRWDLNASEETRRVHVPRYIRRHYAQASAPGQTRRQRKARARIARAARVFGPKPERSV